jgi:hypothetical protein
MSWGLCPENREERALMEKKGMQRRGGGREFCRQDRVVLIEESWCNLAGTGELLKAVGEGSVSH